MSFNMIWMAIVEPVSFGVRLLAMDLVEVHEKAIIFPFPILAIRRRPWASFDHVVAVSSSWCTSKPGSLGLSVPVPVPVTVTALRVLPIVRTSSGDSDAEEKAQQKNTDEYDSDYDHGFIPLEGDENIVQWPKALTLPGSAQCRLGPIIGLVASQTERPCRTFHAMPRRRVALAHGHLGGSHQLLRREIRSSASERTRCCVLSA